MTICRNDDFLRNLSKLNVATDYILWQLRLLAYVRRDESFPNGLDTHF